MLIEKDPTTKISYYISGDNGPWVTLINGYTRPASDFRTFSKRLVAQGFRTLTLDNRGAGETETRSFSFADMVDDIAFLWRHLEIRSTHVIGISMGGWLAQKLASTKPSQISSLTLISTSSTKDHVNNDEAPWGKDFETILRKLIPYFSPPFATKNKLLLTAMAKQIHKNNLDGHFSDNAAMQKQAISNVDISTINANIKAPTLIIHGDQDQIIAVEAATETKGKIRQAQLKIYPEKGHLLLAEAPKQLYQDVIEHVLNHSGSDR